MGAGGRPVVTFGSGLVNIVGDADAHVLERVTDCPLRVYVCHVRAGRNLRRRVRNRMSSRRRGVAPISSIISSACACVLYAYIL